MQGAKCYIILAPAFQRLYERKIDTLKTGRLIEGGRLVQRRSQGRVYVAVNFLFQLIFVFPLF